MPILVVIWQLAVGAFAFIRALPKEVLYPALTAGGLIFFYEGISLHTPWPVSLVWSGSVIDGRVDRIRNAADARCALRIQKSIEAATKIDSAISADRMGAMQDELDMSHLRELAAVRQSGEYQDEVDRLKPELQACRKATDSDRSRLRR